jgi:hypothetical protein
VSALREALPKFPLKSAWKKSPNSNAEVQTHAGVLRMSSNSTSGDAELVSEVPETSNVESLESKSRALEAKS